MISAGFSYAEFVMTKAIVLPIFKSQSFRHRDRQPPNAALSFCDLTWLSLRKAVKCVAR